MKLQYKILNAAMALLFVAHVAQADSTDNSLEWPDVKHSYQQEGDFIAPQSVARVKAGVVTQDETRLLLANPHFYTGYLGGREWDYIFNFYTGNGNEHVTCQYKVLFNNKMMVSSTHWKNPECEKYLQEPKPAAPAVVTPHKVTLRADGLFNFAKSDINNLLPEGQRRLSELATQLKTGYSNLESVSVTGYTDRLGSIEDNLTLSHARAVTVKEYLVNKGVPRDKIITDGKGEANPVVNCSGSQTPKLIACLMPNRRIEVMVKGDSK